MARKRTWVLLRNAFELGYLKQLFVNEEYPMDVIAGEYFNGKNGERRLKIYLRHPDKIDWVKWKKIKQRMQNKRQRARKKHLEHYDIYKYIVHFKDDEELTEFTWDLVDMVEDMRLRGLNHLWLQQTYFNMIKARHDLHEH